jgi:hypothetical protein
MNSVANANTDRDSKVGKELPKRGVIFWGVIASPYQLKMQALADFGGLPWQRWPDQKTFQVAVWRELRVHCDTLAESDREHLSHLLPAIADINQSYV